MSRPVDPRYKMIFGFKAPYNPTLQALTGLKYHYGQDFACPNGTAVMAGVDGWWLGAEVYRGYGYMAQIITSVGRLWWKRWYIIRYAHLTLNSARFSRYGEPIKEADQIALSGDSGGTLYADNAHSKPRRHPHLHFEVWRAEKIKGAWVRVELVDPAPFSGVSNNV